MASSAKPEVQYITYNTVISGGTNHGHMQANFFEVWTVVFEICEPTDRQTCKLYAYSLQTRWSQYFAVCMHLSSWGDCYVHLRRSKHFISDCVKIGKTWAKKYVFSPSTRQLINTTFAAERRAAAPMLLGEGARRCRSMCCLRSAQQQTTARRNSCWTIRQTDGRRDARPLHRRCCRVA